MTDSKFTTWHNLDLKEISVFISIDWNYYPGHMVTYDDPEEPETVELIQVNVPDPLEYRREEVEWKVEDLMGELQDEALEQIHNHFERMEVVGNDYS